MSDQELKIIIEPSYKAGETLGTVTIKDCKFVDFECANCASLIAEVERLRAALLDALRSLPAFAHESRDILEWAIDAARGS